MKEAQNRATEGFPSSILVYGSSLNCGFEYKIENNERN